LDDVGEQFAMLLLSLEKRVQQKEEELTQFRVRADEYCRDQEAEIVKAKAQVELIRAQMLDLTEGHLESPLSTKSEARATSSINQSDRIREAARLILREAGEPITQRELKRRMEAKGFYVQARNPVDLIRSALRRNSEFRHVQDTGWTLADAET